MSISLEEYLRRGPATSKEIQAETGLSQTAVSRRLRHMGSRVIQLREGRSLRYAMTRNAFGVDDSLPLYMVDAHGNNTSVANIRPLAHGGFFVEALTGMPSMLLGESKTGFYSDLPYFLYDLAPQGFMGRQIAKEMAKQSPSFPPDPRIWNVDHIGQYLVSNGDDLPGNFKLGHQAHLRVCPTPINSTPDDYPDMADSVLSGKVPGSSAGGEQPKFTAFCGKSSSHVIVKFSPKGDDPVARRWRDILITEFHATEAIRAAGFPAAETRLIETGGRIFLESQRFDRVGEKGRLSMVSLQLVDGEFNGEGSGWCRAMDALAQQNLVSGEHCFDAQILYAFGLLIHNTDMHLGNLSLAIEGDVFRILPAYDMCSMGFAPKSGEVLPFAFSPPALDNLTLRRDDIRGITNMAHDFWNRVYADERISDEFRDFLDQGIPIERIT